MGLPGVTVFTTQSRKSSDCKTPKQSSHIHSPPLPHTFQTMGKLIFGPPSPEHLHEDEAWNPGRRATADVGSGAVNWLVARTQLWQCRHSGSPTPVLNVSCQHLLWAPGAHQPPRPVVFIFHREASGTSLWQRKDKRGHRYPFPSPSCQS